MFFINILGRCELLDFVGFDHSNHEDDKFIDELVLIKSLGSPAQSGIMVKLNQTLPAIFHLYPFILPMFCPPVEWSETKSGSETIINYGGYLSNVVNQESLIHSSSFSNHSLSNIPYKLINSMQSIPYTINSSFIDYLLNDGEYLLDHYKITSDKCIPFEYLSFELAKILTGRKFYMPLFLDWRGRVYTKNLTLNYQGGDFMNSIIEFYHRKPITSKGFEWLKVHGANCYGIDKVTFDKRIEWVNTHHNNIIAMESSFIMGADSPIKFAAFCLAYSTYIKDPSTPLGLPVFLDATCSGLQHISALLRDEILGQRVNLKGLDRRDLYSETLVPINKALSTHENHKFHTIKLSRSLIKKPIMTIPYSITTIGITHQLADSLQKIDGLYYIPSTTGVDVSLTYKELYALARVIHKTILDIYPSINLIFNYFMQWVNLAHNLGMTLYWETPAKTKIIPKYLVSKAHRHSISFKGKVHKLVYYDLVKPHTIDKATMKSSIVPNIVHSFDAAHLFNLVNLCIHKEISVMTIHDCFGVHPNHVDDLRELIKAGFIE